MKNEEFIGTCIKEMISSGVTIEFVKRKYLTKNSYSYFMDSNGTVPNFRITYFDDYDFQDCFITFVHEYCHFLQWKESSELFSKSDASIEKLINWLDYKTDKFDIRHLRTIQKMELECDKKASKLIKSKNLKIDLEKYIKQSNSYILSYNYVYENRYFFKEAGYAIPEALDYIPKRHFRVSELGKNIPEHREIFMKYSK